jgi:hypothetical protein
MMQEIESDVKVAFRVDPERPKRLLLWGPSYEKNNLRLKEAIEAVRVQNKKILAFVGCYARSAIANIPLLNAYVYHNWSSAAEIVEKEKCDLIVVEDAHILLDLERFLDFVDTKNLTAFVSALSTRTDGEPWTSVVEIFHTCRIHPIPDECQSCRRIDGFFTCYSESWKLAASSDDEAIRTRTYCAACFKTHFKALPGLETLDSDSAVEFAQDMIHLMAGNSPILTCSEDDSSELEDEFGDLTLEDRHRLGFMKNTTN